MNFNLKKFSKTQLFIWITLLSSILWIIWFFFFSNWVETEFNSVTKNWNINNQKWYDNIIVNTVEAWSNLTIAEKINNYYPDTKNPEYLNERDEFTSTLFWNDLIEAFFELWNFWKYREACSLLNRNTCNSSIGSNISWFLNYWKKLDWGYKILNIHLSNKVPDNWEKVFCVRYEYKLKQDMSSDKIQELFQFRVREREDWLEEITSRVCEKIIKWNKEKRCPIMTSNLYCNN